MSDEIEIIHHPQGEWSDSPFRKPRIIFGGPNNQALEAVQKNKCPNCGSPLKKSPEMRGLYQCVTYGNPEINPRCNWQTILPE
jgi:hypothetical protein